MITMRFASQACDRLKTPWSGSDRRRHFSYKTYELLTFFIHRKLIKKLHNEITQLYLQKKTNSNNNQE